MVFRIWNCDHNPTMVVENPYGEADLQTGSDDSSVLIIEDDSPANVFWKTVAIISSTCSLWMICTTYGDLAFWYFDSTSWHWIHVSPWHRTVVYASAEFSFAGMLAIIATIIGFSIKLQTTSLSFLFIRMTLAAWVMLLLCYTFVRI